MNPENREPSKTIAARIRAGGSITFAEFMQLALYHPEGGYYVQPRVRIGRAGDFFTNVSVGSAFGEILAEQYYEAFGAIGRPADFTLVEQGAESGQLAADIIQRLIQISPADCAQWRYIIVEPLAQNHAWQAETLKDSPIQVNWVTSIADLHQFSGIVLAHELLDAFPCFWLEFKNGVWHELRVTAEDDRLVTLPYPITDPRLAAAVLELPSPVTEPYRTEINLAASAWVEEVSAKLRTGLILIVDYGFSRSEYYNPTRIEGTLTGYSHHRRIDSVLDQPGQIDITAHLDFTALAKTAEAAHLKVLGFADQHHFMVGAAKNRLLAIEQAGAPTPRDHAFIRTFRSLMHPATMGLAFKYLLLGNALPSKPLSGFLYGLNPPKALGY
ncbi:MAG: SAM-dependent methyltransferase [Verrucomicrobia bacterium]|nr:SAM-dependent methyltransferase [Verrucomicrobiota bacterium]